MVPKSCDHQLRLVVYPMIYRVLYIPAFAISSLNTRKLSKKCALLPVWYLPCMTTLYKSKFAKGKLWNIIPDKMGPTNHIDKWTYFLSPINDIKLTALQHSVRTFQADSHGRLKGPALSQNIQRYIHMQDNNQEHTFTWIKWHSSFSTGVVAWVYTNLSLSSSCTARKKHRICLPDYFVCCKPIQASLKILSK